MADKGLKYVGTNPIKGMALGSQVGHKLYLSGTLIWEDPVIEFEDSAVKSICVSNWGGHKISGEITESEAAAVTSLADKFRGNTSIAKFNELRYFTGLTTLYISGSSTNSIGGFYGCTSLSEVTLPSKQLVVSGAFRGCTSFLDIDISNLKGEITCNGTFYGANKVVNIKMPGISYLSAVYTWRGCTKLKKLVFDGTADFSNCTSLSNAFYNCSVLEDIEGIIVGIKQDVDLHWSDDLTRDSLLVIINGLADLTGQTGKTLTLHSTAKARLTAEDISIAQNKNWQIA